jgi:putative DNA primase/helicase
VIPLGRDRRAVRHEPAVFSVSNRGPQLALPLLQVQTADCKNRDHWSGQLPTRIVVLTNELPRFSDSSGALASRFVILLLTASFYGRENANLTAELTAELPGIFVWALDGLERLRERGRFAQPAASQDALPSWRLSSPVGAFVRERCKLGGNESVDRAVLYAAYRDWCNLRGYSAMNTTPSAEHSGQ